MQLRKPQQEAIAKALEYYTAGVNRQVVMLPTGVGKTPVMASIREAFGFQGRVLVLDHREELIHQVASTFKAWNPKLSVGIEMAEEHSNNEDIVVASIQTIGKNGGDRLKKLKKEDFDAILTDEAHHAVAQTYMNVYNHFDVFQDKRILSLGVSATINRADGHELGNVFQEIVYKMSILEAMEQGWIVDLRGIRVDTAQDLDDLHKLAGDFNKGELSQKIDTPAMNDLVARSWIEKGEDRKTVVYGVDVKHCQNLSHAFKRYGLAFEAVWGNDPDRAEKIKLHKENKLKGLINCELLIEGYDDKEIRCILLDRPTGSEPLYTQMIGRGSRLQHGIDNLVEAKAAGTPIIKDDCLIIDAVGNSKKHSLVTLPSLFGLNQDMNLKGKKISLVMAEVNKIKKDKPFVDLTVVKDVDKLKGYAQEVDLFKVNFPEEIVSISPYQWRYAGDNAYVLVFQGGTLTVIKDILDNWHIVGEIDGVKIFGETKDFSKAISYADEKFQLHATAWAQTCAKRVLKKDKGKPSPEQLRLAARIGLKVPDGATFGDVRLALNKRLEEIKKRNRQRVQNRNAYAQSR